VGKRSNFARMLRDAYATPFAAVPPLIARLNGTKIFAEPCAGDGALVRHLEGFGLICTYAGDIADGQDALKRKSYGNIDAIITNPPYDRPLMHALIQHFTGIAPTWLLMEWDWAATRQAEPYLPFCSDIVVVGRLKLIPDSPSAGKENFAWYRFAKDHAQGPMLRPRRRTLEGA